MRLERILVYDIDRSWKKLRNVVLQLDIGKDVE